MDAYPVETSAQQIIPCIFENLPQLSSSDSKVKVWQVAFISVFSLEAEIIVCLHIQQISNNVGFYIHQRPHVQKVRTSISKFTF